MRSNLLRSLAGIQGDDVVPTWVEPGDTVATARGVSVSYGDDLILDDVDLDLRAGELLVLVGPNGAGKSTLLALLSGDLEPDSGTIEIFGRGDADWPPVEIARRRAVLTQSVDVAFPFTVDDVVRMGRTPWERTAAEDRDDEVVTSAIETADVAHLRGRRYPSLSGGERARSAFARVLAQSAQLVLLDEPTAALDIHHQEHVMAEARALADAGAAVLAVLHDLGLAASYAHRVAVLGERRIQKVGPPTQVMEPDLLSRVYGHEIEVFPHPRTGAMVVLPIR